MDTANRADTCWNMVLWKHTWHDLHVCYTPLQYI